MIFHALNIPKAKRNQNTRKKKREQFNIETQEILERRKKEREKITKNQITFALKELQCNVIICVLSFLQRALMTAGY